MIENLIKILKALGWLEDSTNLSVEITLKFVNNRMVKRSKKIEEIIK